MTLPTNRQWVEEVVLEIRIAESGMRDASGQTKQGIVEHHLNKFEEAKQTINQKINQELEELLESLPKEVKLTPQEADGKCEDIGINVNSYVKEARNKVISEVRSIVQAKIKGNK